ncbi:hypothetical protein C1H46_045754 [Malus baccata]|uniref:Uncharacterized protein n=1 Tax=Malus baccata TaxID=106549 RepID=A0A540K386_MALBA|nr:hypothetical protein C1H46_045754 [Malus baccata]
MELSESSFTVKHDNLGLSFHDSHKFEIKSLDSVLPASGIGFPMNFAVKPAFLLFIF